MNIRHPLTLHIPEPKHRPGEPADFSDLRLPKAGTVARPPLECSAFETRDLAYALISVSASIGSPSARWCAADRWWCAR